MFYREAYFLKTFVVVIFKLVFNKIKGRNYRLWVSSVLLLTSGTACEPAGAGQRATATAAPRPAPGLPALPALPADSLGLHATVREVIDSVRGDRAYSVRLPQVQLPNVATARRINAVLVQQLAEVADTVPPLAAQQAVRLARPMLRTSNDGYNSGSLSYQLCYNAHGLLSLAFNVNQQGTSIEDSHHLTFDLRTGRLLTPADLVARPQALARSLAQRRTERYHEQVAAIAEELPDDPEMRNQLESNMSPLLELSLASADFYLTRHGMVFFENLTKQYPHPYYNLAPDPNYVYSFSELRPWRRQAGPWRAPSQPGTK